MCSSRYSKYEKYCKITLFAENNLEKENHLSLYLQKNVLFKKKWNVKKKQLT